MATIAVIFVDVVNFAMVAGSFSNKCRLMKKERGEYSINKAIIEGRKVLPKCQPQLENNGAGVKILKNTRIQLNRSVLPD